MGDEDDVVVALVDLALDDLPLLLIGCAELLHADGDMAHFEDGAHDLLAFFNEIDVGGTDEDLILFVHWNAACVGRDWLGEEFEIPRGRRFAPNVLPDG